MQSTLNNSNNYDASAWSISHCEKNEYYTDFGLAKGQKKDSKSHSKKALEQSEERQNKLAQQVSQLPKKLQAKLQEVVLPSTATSIGKTKNAPITKPFYDRQKKATQSMLLDDYDEHCLAEDDALNEVHTEAVENMYHQEMERQLEEDEARYQAYLTCKFKWDFPDDNMSQWDLMCLKDEIQQYEEGLRAKWQKWVDGEKITISDEEDIEKKRSYNLDLATRLNYGLTIQQHEYEEAERKHEADVAELEAFYQEKNKNYNLGLEMWLKYGLTKEQYEANRKYESNVRALQEFYQEPDYWNYPDYEMRLKAAIKKYEDDFEAEQKEQELKDQQNDWWLEDIDILKAEDDLDKQNEWWKDYEPEKDDEEDEQDYYFESYEDYCERRREEDIEAQRQNAIDDMYDDY